MASPLVNVQQEAFSPLALEARRADILRHIARSERQVSVCPASRLEVRPRPEMLSSSIPELDALTGGIPRGCITEICGGASSGKSSALLAALARATRHEESCVLIDASDSFDPKSAEAAGVDFGRFLWVRCGSSSSSSSCRTSPHDLTNNQRPTTNHRGPSAKSRERKAHNDVHRNPSEFRLEQVLKAADLILQSGGFGLVALDLAGIPDKFVRRIPLASWFRFQRAVEHTKTALLVISEFACAQTCAALVMKLSALSHHPSKECSQGCPTLVSPFLGETGWETAPAHAQIFGEMRVEVELTRSRLERKPMRSVKTGFTTHSVRAG